ncbi:TPA: hypothetical protein U2L42_001908 [Citrobacter amalonaticus]|uniref:DUF4145 domain-containing protein n=1 Tax=Citrobacter amalonaticus TaxID=35703 RepID=A0ABY0HZQ0_CITAM|nr:hypothetical protein [Citrobacter amalonaticus]MZK88024.1 hypothetical protein [Citrobacter amalonaticus]MZK92554.1 hypothetical protein [Citrobacter amalonaticus]MZL02248.1 hypothetical protein [Citrobacter amalonaticus]MZL15838.1 hypothetical protein [Citrobacter amalonaticus]MZL24636.1 hypothetical protein [Citrobacter amalonaticus]
MNPAIFVKIFGKVDISKLFLAIDQNEDELGSVLRIHLMCERLLDAWIAAHLDNDNLFQNSASEKIKFNPSYAMKLGLAKKLGLHEGLCSCLQTINKIRNSFAHRYDCDPLSERDMHSMAGILKDISLPEKVKSVDDVDFTIIDNDGQETKRYSFNDEKTPNRIRLTIIFANILARILSIVGENLKKNPLGFKY